MTEIDPNLQSGDGSAQGGAGGTGDEDVVDETASGDQTGQQTPPADTTGKTYTQAEFEQLRARMIAADKRASENDAKLKQLVDKDLPELDRVTKERDEHAARADAAEAALQQERVNNAFLTNNKYDWHNPQRAREALDMSKVLIDSDGTVTGLDDAIEALAKSDPYLIKSTTVGEKEKPKPGTAAATAGGSGGSTATTKKLAERIPALRGRSGTA